MTPIDTSEETAQLVQVLQASLDQSRAQNQELRQRIIVLTEQTNHVCD